MTERLSSSFFSRKSPRSIGSGIVLALFLVRFFDVAESAGQGETLWVVALWMIAWLLSLVVTRWVPDTPRVEFGWLDLFVSLLATGHLISAAIVIATVGEKRTAINLAWEWCGVLVAWFLLRRECQNVGFRADLLAGLIAVGTVMAGLGLYQHYVEFPGLAAKYGPQFDRLKVADPAERALISQELMADQIPVEGAGLILFEKRLRDSREPLGLFALANTFGGFLAVSLFLTVGLGLSAKMAVAKGLSLNRVVWISMILLLGWCLMLTKSRTAWAGTAVATLYWLLGNGPVKWTRTRVVGALAAIAAVVFVAWGLSRLGGLDRQVLTEAPKSLQYRLQYWRATVAMIADHPVFGVGPGQFRSAYLYYKVPEASEEISDPHNLVLDVWANGGLVALCGLVGFSAALILCRRAKNEDRTEPTTDIRDLQRFIVVAVAAAVGWSVALLTGYDDRLLILLPLSVALFYGIRRRLNPDVLDSKTGRVAVMSAILALMIHLLGAGGIGMPAVSLLLLGLVAVSDCKSFYVMMLPRCCSWLRLGIQSALVTSLLVALFWTAWRPSRLAQAHLRAGDGHLQHRRMESADAEYAIAAEADTLTPEPWRRRAELAYRGVEANGFRSNSSWENAVKLLREAQVRDPANCRDDQRIGEWSLDRWRTTNRPADALAAAEALDRAWQRYPTSALLMSDLAKAYAAAGDTKSAADLAARSLQQDAINCKWTHVDRILPDPIRQEMVKMVKRVGEQPADEN